MFKEVNHSRLKVDGLSLAAGKALFVDDMDFRELLIVKFMKSPHAHAEILSIDTSAAEAYPGVHAVIHHGNTSRIPHTTAGQGHPEPSPYDTYMFDKKVRYVGDPVAAVAADTAEIALEAIKLIKVEYKELEAVLSIADASKPGVPVIHDEEDSFGIYDREKNLAGHVDVKVGDVEKALADSEFTVEYEIETHYSQHTPIEPHICISYLEEKGRLVIRTSTQVPFHVRRICAKVLEMPEKNIRVVKPRIGGGFGTKQEVYLEYYAGMITKLTGRPAKVELTREEEFISRTRHPMAVKVKLGADGDGMLNAVEMDVISNTGAYGSHALTVMFNAGSKCLPLYGAKNVRFNGSTVYTNLPVAGAYRGYGATQGYACLEQAMDILAEKLKMSPVQLRKINHIKKDETSPIFAALGEGKEGVPQFIKSTALSEIIEWGEEGLNWSDTKPHTEKTGRFRRGKGMAIFMQGSGIPLVDMASASIKINDDGSFNLNVGATDLGTGSDTVLSQIAAEALETTTDNIIIYSSDTDMTPFDVGAYASSTTYISGGAVKVTGEEVLKQIRMVAADMLKCSKEEIELKNSIATSKKDGKTKTYGDIAKYALYINNQFQIGYIGSHISPVSPPPFMGVFTEIEVDTWTGKIEIIKYMCGVDCGTAINPKLAEGQVEGAVVNGLSYALTEGYLFNKKGKMMNGSFQDYKIYNIEDVQGLEIKLFSTFEPTGPFGAKSVSEIGINGPIPAIANALYNAVGVRAVRFPMKPEYILELMEK